MREKKHPRRPATKSYLHLQRAAASTRSRLPPTPLRRAPSPPLWLSTTGDTRCWRHTFPHPLSLATTRRRRPPPPAQPSRVPLPATLPALPPLLTGIQCSGDGKRQFQTVCLTSQSQVSRREPVPLLPGALLHLAGAPAPPITHRSAEQFDGRCPGCVQFSAALPPLTSTTASSRGAHHMFAKKTQCTPAPFLLCFVVICR